MTPSLPSEQELQALPSGPCRHVLLRSKMVRGNITTSGPTPHAALGLQGYVQFTSPIRRYSDMLAHFQLKVNAHKTWVPFRFAINDMQMFNQRCASLLLLCCCLCMTLDVDPRLGLVPCTGHSEGSCDHCKCCVHQCAVVCVCLESIPGICSCPKAFNIISRLSYKGNCSALFTALCKARDSLWK